MNSKLLSVIVVLMMCLPVLAAVDVSASPDTEEETAEDPGVPAETDACDHKEGEILVRDPDFSPEKLNVPCTSAERLFEGSPWFRVVLKDGTDAAEAVETVRASGMFDEVCLNMVYRTTASDPVDVSGNPDVGLSTYLDSMGIRDAWQALVDRGIEAGGDRDVVIAVVDSGVDYNHEDLKANIWHNEDEIPDNGIDDDGNGYIDDTIGWNFVNDNGMPMDGTGHGTHVAGIIAAENNDKGTVGVAFNCRIMPLKAGDSHGTFDDFSVARAVSYAHDNGAQVINMSIGGPGKSPLQYEAMKDAQDTCIIVAAAGNEKSCNDMEHGKMHKSQASYPGAYTFNIGVMSADKDGMTQSWFSNYDHVPFDNTEYDVYSAGTEIYSTYPHGRYATLSGTSMATPVMSGIVALLLSLDPDRDVLTLDMVRSAAVNAGSIHPFNPILGEKDMAHRFCNAMDAIRILDGDGQPFVNPMSLKYADRETGEHPIPVPNTVYSGSSVRIGADLFNRGTDAGAVTLSFMTDDPYITADGRVWEYGGMPVYTGRECVMTGDDGIGCFDVDISPDCPDAHVLRFSLKATYTDPRTGGVTVNVRDYALTACREMMLPAEITEDRVFGSDYSYLFKGDVDIPAGVSVVFGEGCKITARGSGTMTVAGSLEFRGSPDSKVSLTSNYSGVCIEASDGAELVFSHCTVKDFPVVSAGGSLSEASGYFSCDVSLNTGSVDPMLMNFCDSVFEGNVMTLSVDGASGSVFRSVNSMDLSFVNRPVRDCVVIADMDSISECALQFLSDADNVLVTGVPGNEEPFYDLSSEDGVSLSRVCLLPPFEGQEDLPSVPFAELDLSRMMPMVVGYAYIDAEGRTADFLQNDKYTLRLEMSRPMDVSDPLKVVCRVADSNVSFDCKGGYVSDTVWEGTVDMSPADSFNHIITDVTGGSADGLLLVPSDGHPRMEMHLHEEPVIDVEPRESGPGAEVSFFFPDYLDCYGYNLYRTDVADGVTVMVNNAMIFRGVIGLEDTEALPGHTYRYSVTWFDRNLKESPLYGEEVFTVPMVEYHVNGSVIAGNDLKIWIDVIGDIDASDASVRYWTSDGWKGADAEPRDGSFLAVIPGEDVTGDGLEFYITATDGEHTVTAGDGHHPLFLNVHVQDGMAVSVAAIGLAVLSLLLMAVLRRR